MAQAFEVQDQNESAYKVAEGFDYPRTVNEKLSLAMGFSRRSKDRALAVKDLDDLLFPKRDKQYDADMHTLTRELGQQGKNPPPIRDFEAYSQGLLRVLLGLMDRRNLLGGSDVEEEF